jgi:hypothetical protein
MRVRILPFIAILVLVGMPAAAQVSSADSINVNAQNVGAFVFNIDQASYDFGQITSLGVANVGGTEVLTPSTTASSATYTSNAAAVTFNVGSAPQRTVYFYNSSGAQTLNWGTANDLEVQMTGVAVGTNCGFKGVGVTGNGLAGTCAAGNLHHSLAGVGRGANSVNGNLQFRVTVDDADATGTNAWVVQITAAAP